MKRRSLLARELDRRHISDKEKRWKIAENIFRATISAVPGGGALEKAIFSLTDAERAQAIDDAISLLFENTGEARFRVLDLEGDVQTLKGQLTRLDLDIEERVQKMLDDRFGKEINYELMAGYLTIPTLPEDFTAPAASLERIESSLEKKRICQVYGNSGSGKSVIAAKMARDRKDAGLPVFWFKFRSGTVTDQDLKKSLLAFLREKADSESDNFLQLLQQVSPLLIFDDLQTVVDEKLIEFLRLLASLISDHQTGLLLLTGQKRADFLPPGVAAEPVSGLSGSEAETLLLKKWQLNLNHSQSRDLIGMTGGNPQYLQLFKNWYHTDEGGPAKLTDYIRHAPDTDRELKNYLMDRLYSAFGGAGSNLNKLLTAAAFYRIPETESFLEEMYETLQGIKFKETLYLLDEKRGLLQRIPQAGEKRYNVHDILKEFYYQLLSAKQKKQLHGSGGKLYDARNQKSFSLVNHIEGAHHYCKAELFEESAALLLPVWFDSVNRGYYWREIKHILENIEEGEVRDEKKLTELQFARGTVYYLSGEWDRALEYYEKSLEISKKVGDVHGMAQTYGNMGSVYNDKGEWDRALEYYEKSLE
ncbi:MAG: tetratricopeptide repeat protein, partial [Calditrichia bacterium]